MRPLLLLAGCAPAPDLEAPRIDAVDPAVVLPDAPRGAPTGTWPRVLVNEVMPSNQSVLLDEHGTTGDWIELYNAASHPVDLGGWWLADDEDPDWEIPSGTTIGPGEHLVVWADGDEGPLHADFSLSRRGETVTLFSPDGRPADALTWPELPKDVAWGRFPSGGVHRAATIVATPYNTNPVDPGLSTDPSDALFPWRGLILMDMWLPQEGHDTLLEHDRIKVEGGFGFEGMYLSPVGIGIKGGIGTRRTIDEKCGFKIGLDHYVPKTRLRGMEHITLNTMVSDPSSLHESLTYALFRDADVPAPRTTHVELWMNGEYRGLYLHIESVDDQFLKRWFDDPNGNLYEGNYGDDLTVAQIDDFGLDEQGSDDVTDRSELRALAEFLAQPPSEALMPEFERRVNLDRTLRMFAGEALTAHWDGYIWGQNNYRIYHEPSTDQWTMLPWGTDNTFESERDPYRVDGKMIRFCLGIPSCAARYDAALLEMADRMDALDCQAWADEVVPRNRPLFEADTRKEASVQAMDDSVVSTLAFCEEWPQTIRNLVRR
ncbi:MAG: CotH kinase family protein [Alphaproteobacteria bacterium]|nr:CotH kinase family protein [Alphaproteobacteria bacterium]MCB9697440.1 CotH kinase family protein [Alphaproteobacteria bacterium]